MTVPQLPDDTTSITPGVMYSDDYDPKLVLRMPGDEPPTPLIVVDDKLAPDAEVAGAVFHLPGKHDQRSHGHGHGGVESADDVVTGEDVHSQVKNYAELSSKHAKAVHNYQDGVDRYGQEYYQVHSTWLRGEKGDLEAIRAKAPKHVVPSIESLDGALATSKLKADVRVHKGVTNGHRAFGDKWSDDDMTGVSWTNHTYSSTSSDVQVARNFTDHRWDPWHVAPDKTTPTVLNIFVPKGHTALSVTDPSYPSSRVNIQKEVLLPRGITYHVTGDQGVVNGIRYLDVEVTRS